MKTKSLLGALAALMLLSGTASAVAPMDSIRKQIYSNAKREGVLKGLKRPSMRLTNNTGTTVNAAIYSIGNGGHPIQPRRLRRSTATFQIRQVSEGKLAVPQAGYNGKTWQPVYSMSGRVR